METERLTTQDYWVKYYASSSEDKAIIIKTCSFYDRIWDRMFTAVSSRPQTLLEIGAFPGRYLAYLSDKFKVRSTGLDFNPEREKFARTMAVMGVDDYEYVVADFLTAPPKAQYDMVISNGFIEHFEDFETVMDRHVPYLKPGGAMVIMVPNKRFLRFLYGLCLDRQNLRIHNLKCMRKRVFRDFAVRNGLEVLDIAYFGGFSYKVHAPLGRFGDLIFRGVMKVFKKLNPVLARFPNRLWSGSLIGIYYKPIQKP